MEGTGEPALCVSTSMADLGSRVYAVGGLLTRTRPQRPDEMHIAVRRASLALTEYVSTTDVFSEDAGGWIPADDWERVARCSEARTGKGYTDVNGGRLGVCQPSPTLSD